MAGAVHEPLAPPGVGDDLPAGLVDRRRRPRPARTAATPAAWLAATTSTMRASSAVGQLADPDRPGHVGAVAVDDARRSRSRPARPARSAAPTAGGGAWPRSGPDATIVSNDGPLAPSRAHLEVEGPAELDLGRAARPAWAGPRPGPASAMRGRPGQAGQLAGVLDPAQRLDQRPRSAPARRRGTSRRAKARCRAQLTWAASSPSAGHAAGATAAPTTSRWPARGRDLDAGVDAARRPAARPPGCRSGRR